MNVSEILFNSLPFHDLDYYPLLTKQDVYLLVERVNQKPRKATVPEELHPGTDIHPSLSRCYDPVSINN